ncbi:MAG: hypothetical protein E7812_13190 [Phenylobacterium sp.]|nr:MAG: hypothetical protein E7812_13190 [Phenylobacterium sp.]
MFPKSAIPMTLAAMAALSGCQRHPAQAPDPAQAEADQAGYASPPIVTQARPQAGGVQLSGAAPAGAQVRLGAPTGGAVFARADAAGRWSLVLPPDPHARIFGLSAKVGGRQVQGQGYVLVTPQGPAGQLRAGAGAIRLDPQPTPSIGALDFDRAGAAVISGRAPPASLVFLRLDGRQIAQGHTDPSGRYAIALSQPIPHGAHGVEMAGDGFARAVRVQLTPPAPLAAGPLRSQLSGDAVRVDWMTPGGGLQSTILPN